MNVAGFVKVQATFAGIVELINCKLGPFHCDNAKLGISFTASVQVLFVEFKITIKYTLGGSITVKATLYIRWVGKPFAGFGNGRSSSSGSSRGYSTAQR